MKKLCKRCARRRRRLRREASGRRRLGVFLGGVLRVTRCPPSLGFRYRRVYEGAAWAPEEG